jgi:predicted acetyltransferase
LLTRIIPANPPVTLKHRRATLADCRRLAALNHQLIRDEGARNPMTVDQLEERMRGWLDGEYAAYLFEQDGEAVAYALFREENEEIYLRQLFVVRGKRRLGIGRRAFGILRNEVWPNTKRLTVSVFVENAPAVAFWRSVGCKDYVLTLEIMPKITPT